MIRSILNFVGREIRGLHTAAYLLGAFTILSALLALVRDHLLASTFGAGALLDVYYAAFRIPDLVFVGIASLISATVLVPMLSDNHGKEAHARVISGAIAVVGMVMVVVSIGLYLAMPALSSMLFPSLATGQYGGELLLFSRLLLIQPILLGISGILLSIAQVHARYILYALSPLLYNLGIIFGIVALYPVFGSVGLIYGVVFGALLHTGILIPFALRHGYIAWRYFCDIPYKTLFNMARTSLPRMVSLSANKFTLLMLVIIAAPLGAGAVSVFNFSFNLQSAPLSIIGASYSVAAFPVLARLFAKNELDDFVEHVFVATRHIFFWALPLTTLFIVLRAHIVRVVLGAGEFDWNDTRLTAVAFAFFIVSLVAQALILLFTRSYYAAGKTAKPLIINICTTIVSVLGAYIAISAFRGSDMWRFFVESLLRVEDIPGTIVLMLPLAYMLASLAAAFVFGVLFARDFNHDFARNIIRPLFEHAAGAIVAGFAAYKTLQLTDTFFTLETLPSVLLHGAIAGVVGVIAGVVLLALFGNRELREVLVALRPIVERFLKKA